MRKRSSRAGVEPEAGCDPFTRVSGIPDSQPCQLETKPAPGQEPEQRLTWEGHLLSSLTQTHKLLF